jgi:argininosuccinate lyase
VPQRTAHEAIGKLVASAMRTHRSLAELSLDELRAASTSIDEGVYAILGARRAVEAFVSSGSTAPREVAKRVRYWQEQLR